MHFKLLAAFSILALSSMSFAQTFADVSGEVKDPTGAIIAGARVTLVNTATNATREAVTNEAGIYSFPLVQPGIYNMRVEKEGFKGATRTNVELQVQQSARIDYDLTVGQVSESIEVTALGALLSSENATVGTVIENKRIVELPLNGRNFLQLVALSPNTATDFPSAGQAGSRQGGIRAAQSISVGGARSQFNHYTLDGVENTDPNFNTFVVLPSIDALQEFKVQTGVYPAEFGRAASQINVSTKSGGNDFHASLFSFVRNDKLDAKNYAFTSARPPTDPFKWNQFGFMFGGPVLIPKIYNGKNRLFFMTNYEWFRQRRQVQGVYSLPSQGMRGGNFNERPINGIFDPRTRAQQGNAVVAQPFPNNTVPASRIHPVSTKLLEFYPAPNLPNADLRSNHVQALGRPIDRDQFIVRGDFVESSKSNWFGRYSSGDENQLDEALRLNGPKIITTFDQYMASNTRVLSPALVTETRFGYTSFYNTTGPQLAFSRDVVGSLGIRGLASGPPVQWGIPSVGIQNYSGFGNDSEGPYENKNSSIQFLNNTSLIRGKHTFRFGGEIRQDRYNQVGNQFARGSFTFIRNATNNPSVANTGDAFADYLLGEVYQPEAAVSIASAQFRANTFYLYFDDTWKISSTVTVNFGIRYENTPPWEDQTGRLFNGIVRQDVRAYNLTDRSIFPFFMRQGASSNDPYAGVNLRWPDIEVRQDGSLGNRLVGRDNNDWAPRFGVTWAPTGKWVIRAGAGAFYSQDTGNPRFDMARNLAGRLRDNANAQFPNLTWDNGLAAIAGGVAQVPRPYTFANPYDRRTPYSIQYMVNVQRELPQNTLVEIGYLGSVSHRLEALRAVNETIPACRTRTSRPGCESDPLAGLSIPTRAPFPTFGRIQLVDNGGSGNYNSLGAKLTKRYSNGMTYLLSYTYAKAIDNASAIRNQGGDTLFPQNSYCRACERARSSFDTRQRFVTSALYDIPVGKGRKLNLSSKAADLIIGGWQLGAILTLQSGYPITVSQGGDPSNTGGFFDRAMATGASPDLPRGQQDPQRFFNTAAFALTPDGMFGNVGRNTLMGPGIIGWDFSTLKDFAFTETHKLQFRFEAFNFANHPNWGNPDAGVTSNNFGRITGTRGNMRNLQFGLKYIF
ncbi:MAG: TonB-dependent receptor [Acidobacteria bacterium]|nr:TonB-dependent receptor [Acidobacteriota bacterium]